MARQLPMFAPGRQLPRGPKLGQRVHVVHGGIGPYGGCLRPHEYPAGRVVVINGPEAVEWAWVMLDDGELVHSPTNYLRGAA